MSRRVKIDLDWTYKGMRTAILENECLKVSILIDYGAKIFELIHKLTGHDSPYHNPRVECRPPIYGANVNN